MQTVNLDISIKPEAEDYPPKVLAKQGDSGRKFTAVITDSGAAYPIGKDMLLSVWYSGTGGKGNYSAIDGKSAFTVSGNRITVELHPGMTSVKGGGTMCLILMDPNGSQIGTWDILYTVEAVPSMEGNEAADYYEAFRELAVETAQNAQKAEALVNGYVWEQIHAVKEPELDAALLEELSQMPDGSVRFVEISGDSPRYMVEDFSSFADKNTTVTANPTTNSITQWNGAIPGNGWSGFVNNGSAILQPHIWEDGSVSMKLTPISGGRMQVRYTFPKKIYDTLEEGQRYTVRAAFRGTAGMNFKAQIQANCKSTNNSISVFDLTEDWVTVVHTFTFSKDRGTLELIFGVAYPGGSAGSMYIGNVSMGLPSDELLFEGGTSACRIYRRREGYGCCSFFSYGTHGTRMQEKSIVGGIVQPMEWIHPYLQPGVEYRTTERWSGSPVYTKLLRVTGLVNGMTVATGLDERCQIVQASVSAEGLISPYAWEGANNYFRADVNTNNLTLYCGSALSGKQVRALLKYVKE